MNAEGHGHPTALPTPCAAAMRRGTRTHAAAKSPQDGQVGAIRKLALEPTDAGKHHTLHGKREEA